MMSTTICITLNTLNTLTYFVYDFAICQGHYNRISKFYFQHWSWWKHFGNNTIRLNVEKEERNFQRSWTILVYICCLQPVQTQGWLKPLHLSMINPFFHSKPHWQQISLVVYVYWSKYSYCVAKWYVILSLPSLFVLSSTNNCILCQLYGAGLSHDVGPMHL